MPIDLALFGIDPQFWPAWPDSWVAGVASEISSPPADAAAGASPKRLGFATNAMASMLKFLTETQVKGMVNAAEVTAALVGARETGFLSDAVIKRYNLLPEEKIYNPACDPTQPQYLGPWACRGQ